MSSQYVSEMLFEFALLIHPLHLNIIRAFKREEGNIISLTDHGSNFRKFFMSKTANMLIIMFERTLFFF